MRARSPPERQYTSTMQQMHTMWQIYGCVDSFAAVLGYVSAVAPDLVFEPELAPQQAAGIVRHARQPLLDGLIFLVLRLVAFARTQPHRFGFALLLVGFGPALLLQLAIHVLAELVAGIAFGLLLLGLLLGGRLLRLVVAG